MKQHISSIVFISLLLLTGGCEDILNVAPDGRLDLKDIFNDQDKTGAFLNSCYKNLPEKGFFYTDEYLNLPMACSDEAFSAMGEDKPTFTYYAGNSTADRHPIRDWQGKSFWTIYYSQIKLCTDFINNIDGANISDPDLKAEWKAEAHVLRAYFLFELMKWFGKLPYEPLGYPQDYDYSKASRLSAWEIATYIEEDCRVAINTAQLPSTRVDDNSVMRMTKAVAWAITSKAYMYAASPLFNENEDVADKWAKAYEMNKEAVTSLEGFGYRLFTEATDPTVFPGKAGAFQQLLTTSMGWPSDKETLWQGRVNGRNPLMGYIGGDWSGAGSPGASPTQELIDAFEVVRADFQQAEPLLDLTKPYIDDQHLNPNYNPGALLLGYSEAAGADPYRNRDPRMKVTVFSNGDEILWNNQVQTVECFVGGQHGINERQDEHRYTRTGYYQRKFVKPGASKDVSVQYPFVKFFRLAEIKLNYAECAIEHGSSAALQEAKSQIDEVRARVGMPKLPSGMNQNQLRLRVRNERRVELAFEENRFFDVRRWQLPNGDLSSTDKFMTAMRITVADGKMIYQRKLIRDRIPTSNAFVNKYLLLPLPQGEAQTMTNKTKANWQNRGW